MKLQNIARLLPSVALGMQQRNRSWATAAMAAASTDLRIHLGTKFVNGLGHFVSDVLSR